jgi:CHC2 zinc finger
MDILQEQRDIFFANLGKCQSRLDPNQVTVVCPFHDDKNPSLSLSDSKSKKVWNCFGCGARGNLFGLEKPMFRLKTAGDALQSLAARYPEVKRIMGSRSRSYLKSCMCD